MKSTRGFTLIELLVVIAIIGILASVVLVSLQSARKKGNDSRVLSDVQQARVALETGFNGSYYADIPDTSAANATNVAATPGSGPNATTLTTLSTDASTNGGSLLYYVSSDANKHVTSYAIYGQLPSTPTSAQRYFCIDSTGATNQSAIAHVNATCPVAGN